MKRREFIILLGGVLRAGGALLATAFSAQGIGRWINQHLSASRYQARRGARAIYPLTASSEPHTCTRGITRVITTSPPARGRRTG
jgi:hypothetical protein